MASQLFSGKGQIFKDVIQLAQTWKNTNDQYGMMGGSMADFLEFQKTPAFQKIDAAKQALSVYMNNLSFDDVKMLQVVMYLGRDRDYDKNQSPVEIYDDYLSSFNQKGWKTKQIEINQMTQKVPLADYLRTGIEILKVAI